jgi:DHA1 family bicyclomycin/chloramphenicol resistance-like MFS transporter
MQYGLLMFSNALAYLLGTFLCRYWLARFGVRRALAMAGGLSLSGGSLMGVLTLAGVQNGWAIMLPQYLFMLGHGVHQPCSQSGAVGPFPQAAGAASALNGFLMMAAAFAVGTWLGEHMDGSAAPLTLGIWFWSVLIALTAWTVVQQHGASSER